jgi:hypothetical protein
MRKNLGRSGHDIYDNALAKALKGCGNPPRTAMFRHGIS